MKNKNVSKQLTALALECEALAKRSESIKAEQGALSAAAYLYDVAAEIEHTGSATD